MRRFLLLVLLIFCFFTQDVFAVDTFGFEVTLEDGSGEDLAGSYPVIVNSNYAGEISSGDVIDLYENDIAYVCDLPDGCEYTVTEVAYDKEHYKPNGDSSFSGTYTKGMLSRAPFDNFYNSRGYVVYGPEMPETGGSGIWVFIIVGVLCIACGIGLFFKKTRKIFLCLILVSVMSLNAFADDGVKNWTIGVGLSCINPDGLHDNIVCDKAIPDVSRAFESGTAAIGSGEYSMLLSDWVENSELVIDLRSSNIGESNYYSRLSVYSMIENYRQELAFREREFSVIDGNCLLLPADIAITGERWLGYFDYVINFGAYVDFRMKFSDGYIPDYTVRDDISFDIKLDWIVDVVQEHNFEDAAMSMWGMKFNASSDGHIMLSETSKKSSRFFNSYVNQGVVVHVIDDRCLEISKTVTEDLS